MVNILQSVHLATGSIKSAKMRSTLTTLGIVIGVAAVIANVSLGASFGQYFTDEIGGIGSNFIVISSQGSNIFYDNELKLVKNIPGVDGVSPVKQWMSEVTYMSTSRHMPIQGVSVDYHEVANLEMEEGNFLNEKDMFVAVIGHDVAYEKFDRKIFPQNSIDITFKRSDGSSVTQRFKIKGIIKNKKSEFVQSGIEPDERIFIPISTLNQILGEDDYGGLFVMASSLDELKDVADEIDKRLARSLGVASRDLDNDDAKPYVMFDQVEILEQTDQMTAVLTGLLTSVAVIALIVGSIGIMNIMLVTVTERTGEIGIMKSLGFTNFDVLSLFIVESIVLSVLGGLLGIVLGVLGAYGAQSLMNLPLVFPIGLIAIGFSVSVIVGLVAGVYPANKAAKMNPVDALRQE